jgi:hypothetical protein
MLTTELIRSSHNAGLPYEAYVATGSPDQIANWQKFHSKVRLTDPQRTLFASFTRRVNVLVISGVWCGDCVQQCPMLDHISKLNPGMIDVRFIDRDQHKHVSDTVRICGGNRVPTVIFATEDFEFVSLLGDRTLSRYRAAAARQLGAACAIPSASVPDDEVAATLQDWVDEFERVQLLLRLSQKLRQRHGD